MQQVGKNKFPNGKQWDCFVNFNNTCQMKITVSLLFALFFLSYGFAAPVSVPLDPPNNGIKTLDHFSRLSMKEIQKLAGRKLTLKEKIAIKFVQWKTKKQVRKGRADETSKLGRTAFLCSILAIAVLGIPMVGLMLSPLFIIAALILGYKARRENPNDRKARSAITIAWVALAVFAVITTIVIAILTSMTFAAF